MASVLLPPQRKTNLDVLQQGLQIAQALYGIRADMARVDDYKARQTEAQETMAAQQKSRALTDQQTELENKALQAKLDKPIKSDSSLTKAKLLEYTGAKGDWDITDSNTPGARAFDFEGDIVHLIPKKAAEKPQEWAVSSQEYRDDKGQTRIGSFMTSKSGQSRFVRSPNDPLAAKQPEVSQKSEDPAKKALRIDQEKALGEASVRRDNIQRMSAELKDLIQKKGTFELTGPEASKMDSLIYQMAIEQAKLVDPASVAREGEVAAARRYMLPVRNWGGLGMSNETAASLVDDFARQANETVAIREKALNPNATPMVFAPKAGQSGFENTAIAAPLRPIEEMTEAEIDAEIARLKKGKR